MDRAALEPLLDSAGLGAFSDLVLADGLRLRPILTHPRGEHPWPEGDDPCPNCRRASPRVQPGWPSGMTTLAVGGHHLLGVDGDGRLWSWGGNEFGQLGLGDTTPRLRPERVGFEDATIVGTAAGTGHSLALDRDGNVWSWGWNGHGQLGVGDERDRRRPQLVALPRPATSVASAAMHSFAVLDDGTVMAWGGGWRNTGFLGDGDRRSRSEPVPVLAVDQVVEVVAGAESTLAVRSDGSVWAWGNNADGQLGIGHDAYHQHVPVPTTALPGSTVRVALGWSHGIAIADGVVWTWGRNFNGQLGYPTEDESSAQPAVVELPAVAVDVAATPAGSLALLIDGSIWTWGENSDGELGDGTLTSRSVPQPVGVVGEAQAVFAGDRLVAVATRSDDVVLWGGPDPSGGKSPHTRSPIGATKLGGRPDLGPEQAWPVFEGEPQLFVGQVNLAEIPAPGRDGLPASGVLSFFFATAHRWGFDPADEGAWAVVLSDDSSLRTVELPADLDDQWCFPETRCRVEHETTLAPPDSATVEALGWTDAERSAYEALYEQYDEILADAPRHRMLGHPDPIQGDMQLECQLVTNGIWCGSSAGYDSPRAKELAPGAGAWRLLFQVDSDDSAGINWGDVGRLYYWLTEDDLRARRFDRAWCIEQEH